MKIIETPYEKAAQVEQIRLLKKHKITKKYCLDEFFENRTYYKCMKIKGHRGSHSYILKVNWK